MNPTIKIPIYIISFARMVSLAGHFFSANGNMPLLFFYCACTVIGWAPDLITLGNVAFEKFDVLKSYINMTNAMTAQSIANAHVPYRGYEASPMQRYAITETAETPVMPRNQPFTSETKPKRFEPYTTEFEGKKFVVTPDFCVIDNMAWDKERLESNKRSNQSNARKTDKSQTYREDSAKRARLFEHAILLMTGALPEQNNFSWAVNAGGAR